jgi:hypothetical protein
MVHEKQIRNEEIAALLNQNTDTGTVLTQYAVCLRARYCNRPKEWRLLEILASIL